MKRKCTILTIALMLIVLFLPGALRKAEFPQGAADSVVKIISFYENGEISSGSGFVISHMGSKSMIATCEHVVSDAPAGITVFVDGKEPKRAEVVCASEKNDTAVISIDSTPDLEPLPLTEAGLGSVVYAIGYSALYKDECAVYTDQKAGKAATTGKIISFVGGLYGDTFKIIHSSKETEGASGGALVNWKGEAIGIVAFGMTEPITAFGAVSTRELQKLCNKAGIKYTHHPSLRLIRDAAALILSVALLSILFPDKQNRVKHKKAPV